MADQNSTKDSEKDLSLLSFSFQASMLVIGIAFFTILYWVLKLLIAIVLIPMLLLRWLYFFLAFLYIKFFVKNTNEEFFARKMLLHIQKEIVETLLPKEDEKKKD